MSSTTDGGVLSALSVLANTRDTQGTQPHEAGRVSFLDSITNWRGSWFLQRVFSPGVFDNEIRWFEYVLGWAAID